MQLKTAKSINTYTMVSLKKLNIGLLLNIPTYKKSNLLLFNLLTDTCLA